MNTIKRFGSGVRHSRRFSGFSTDFKYDMRNGMSDDEIEIRVQQLQQGHRVALSRTVTLVESTRPD